MPTPFVSLTTSSLSNTGAHPKQYRDTIVDTMPSFEITRPRSLSLPLFFQLHKLSCLDPPRDVFFQNLKAASLLLPREPDMSFSASAEAISVEHTCLPVSDGRSMDHASTGLRDRGSLVDVNAASAGRAACSEFEGRILCGNANDPLDIFGDVVWRRFKPPASLVPTLGRGPGVPSNCCSN